MKTADQLISAIVEGGNTREVIGEITDVKWGVGVEGARMREEAIKQAIEKMARKYHIKNWNHRVPIYIDSRGNMLIAADEHAISFGNGLEIPDALVNVAHQFAHPPGPHSHVSNSVIELNHFAMEKLLVHLGLLHPENK
jgi:hypothetical protein